MRSPATPSSERRAVCQKIASRWMLPVLLLSLLIGTPVTAPAQTRIPRVLYVCETTGLEHATERHARDVLTTLAHTSGAFTLAWTPNLQLTSEYLASYDAVIFFTADAAHMGPGARKALLKFVGGGKGFVGIHTAAYSERWPEYRALIGGDIQWIPWPATDPQHGRALHVVDPAHRSTRHLGDPFVASDAIPQFRDWLRDNVNVLLRLEDPQYVWQGTRFDQDYAVAWTKPFGAGRVFYTALGSLIATWDDPRYQQHILQGVRWALGEADVDMDEDGMPGDWEVAFGLDPESAAGADGPWDDPDHDGAYNLLEYALGTHPRGIYRSYLAEGVTGTFFDTRITLYNYNDSGNTYVQIRLLVEGGGVVTKVLTLPAKARRTIDVDEVPGMAAASFSTIIEHDQALAVARTVTWGEGRAYAAHAQAAVTPPSSRWYFAEGATHGGFDTFFLILNPSATDTAHVTASFLTGAGAPAAQAYDVPPNGRLTIQADQIPGLEAAEFGSIFTTAEQTPVVVERSMYLSRPEQPWAGGHATYGAPSPSRESHFAEGATGSFFETFMLLANPNAVESRVRMRYQTAEGVEIERAHVVPAYGRLTINLANEAPELASTLISTTVEASGDGVVAERTMLWPAGSWHEGHVSFGSAVPWAHGISADAEVGGPSNAQTYLIIKTLETGGPVRVTFYPEDGPPASTAPGWPGTVYDLDPHRRYTINVGAEYPELEGQRFAVEVRPVFPLPSPFPKPWARFFAEVSVYRDADGVTWRSGTNLP